MKRILLFFLVIMSFTFISCNPIEIVTEPWYTKQTVKMIIKNNSAEKIDVAMHFFGRTDSNDVWHIFGNSKNKPLTTTDNIESNAEKELELTTDGYSLSTLDFSFALVINNKTYTGFSENKCNDFEGKNIILNIGQQNLGWIELDGNDKDSKEVYKGTLIPIKETVDSNHNWGMYFTVIVSDSGVDFTLDELVY